MYQSTCLSLTRLIYLLYVMSKFDYNCMLYILKYNNELNPNIVGAIPKILNHRISMSPGGDYNY